MVEFRLKSLGDNKVAIYATGVITGNAPSIYKSQISLEGAFKNHNLSEYYSLQCNFKNHHPSPENTDFRTLGQAINNPNVNDQPTINTSGTFLIYILPFLGVNQTDPLYSGGKFNGFTILESNTLDSIVATPRTTGMAYWGLDVSTRVEIGTWQWDDPC